MLRSPDVGDVVHRTPKILLAYVMAIVDAFEPALIAAPPEPLNPFREES